TEVTGAQMTLTLTGDVKPDDEACTYILSDKVMYGLGAARKTHLKLQKGDKVIIWPVTLANITPAYGDSAAVNALTVTIHGNGRPTIGTGA
ncbi:phage tail tube protein, partial [Blautia producta]